MATDSELAYMSAVGLAARFGRGELSPVEVLRALSERADEHQGLNALVAADARRNHLEAQEAVRRYREGRARPLEGIPVIVKDLIDTEGLRTSYGSRMFSGHVPPRDAAVVERVRAAGGIVVAKSATHEFAWGITTDGSAVGPTRNPWDPTVVPGGSSGGSAAALAAGLAPLAIGTDTAGSIRIPAAFCGVMGLKPTFGLIDTTGVFPLAPSLDQVGPMARTVEDLRLLLSVLAPDGAQAPDPAADAEVVVGIWSELEQAESAPDIAHVFHETVRALENAGVRVVRLSAPGLPPLYPALGTTVAVEGAAGHRGAGLWPARRSEYGGQVRARLEKASRVTVEQYARTQRDRALITAMTARVLHDVDIVLSPVSGVSPARIGHDEVPGAPQALSFRERVMAFTALQSLTGVPTCVVRAGFDSEGLPVGVQLTASWGREHTLLATAQRLVETTSELQHSWPTA
ncbi:amidase [Nonomuraea sp. NBC_00507]|uniref:amidase n=1 Tax=Nonomuraea sp. NBC_00507 TaxID=2976002 RepID=UPI002E172219